MKLPLIIVLIIIAGFAIYYFTRESGSEQGLTKTFTGGGVQAKGSLMGKVVDEKGTAVSSVIVNISGKTAQTNDNGWFTLENVNAGESIVTLSKTGFATAYKKVSIKAGNTTFTDAVINKIDLVTAISAVNGGTVNNTKGAAVIIPTNALTDLNNNDYTGTANIQLTSFNASSESDINAFPGNFKGINLEGSIVDIKSYCFMDVNILDQNGNQLRLKPSKNSTITCPVPESMSQEALNKGTVPLWYFDTAAGTWREEGEAVYDPSTGSFTGDVSHFTPWNIDITRPAAYISGKVVDSNNKPIENAEVKAWSDGWQSVSLTGPDGRFTRLSVEPGVNFKYKVSKDVKESIIFTSSQLSINQEEDVGVISFDAPVLTITLNWNSQVNLGSELIILTEERDYKVDYYTRSAIGASLDAVSINNAGPEVMTITKLQQGRYRFNVNQYVGYGTFSTYGLEVTLSIPNKGIYKYTPSTTQAQGTDVWMVFEINVTASGNITAREINDYATMLSK